MVGKEEQGSGVRDTQTWVSRTKRTLRRRGYFPSLESSPPAGGISPKTKQRFRRCGGEFLSERSERNQRIAGGGSRASPMPYPAAPGPPVYGGVEGAPRRSRPARRPQERCAKIITAVLLNKPDHLLLQDAMRLSCRTYTVGGGRRAATRGRPYGAKVERGILTTPPHRAIISLKFHQREAGRCATLLAEHDRAKDGALAPALSCRCERVLPLFAAGSGANTAWGIMPPCPPVCRERGFSLLAAVFILI